VPEIATAALGETLAMRFVDFSIRAWREGPYLQVIAHSTPAGSMRHPVAVKLGVFNPQDYRIAVDAPLARGADVGRELAKFLLPPEIWRLLGESLAGIAPRSDLGLRLRLCLDEELIDLPWEFLYRPDVSAASAQSGFLLTDGRISLVREPPSIVTRQAPSDRPQRGLFVGTMFDDGSDGWSVKVEHASLTKALAPVSGLLAFEFAAAADAKAVERALATGCEVFHYAGHTDMTSDGASLVQLARAEMLATLGMGLDKNAAVPAYTTQAEAAPGEMEALAQRAPWSTGEGLARHLERAGTRLAVLNACNSGFWPLVRPLMRVGIPAVIGVQGLVSNFAALNFAEKLYQSLAVGLSLDEALTYARLYVMEPDRSYYPCDWGRFMAYMPTDAAVLFPRSAGSDIRKHQQAFRAGRRQTLQDVKALTRTLDGAQVSQLLSEVASRSVLILGRFSKDRKAVLDMIARELRMLKRGYVPIVFDFEKPSDRDLIESVLRFAAVSRFVIADLSDPKSVPAELQQIVPSFPSLPIIPIIEATQRHYPVADNILRRESVHPVVKYGDVAHLRSILDEQVLAPAETLYASLKPRAVL
jgi:hypothetical protein